MVNVGGPSKGCRTCISRKVRCDRQQPACNRCLRSNRQCGGYRDAGDVLFHDQSEQVIARVTGAASGDLRKRRNPLPLLGADVQLAFLRKSAFSPRLGSSVVPSSEDGLITFFTNNFACLGPASDQNTPLWLPSNYDNLKEDPMLSSTIKCLGAMAIGNVTRSADHLRDGRKRYDVAIRAIVGRIADHVATNDGVSDATLIAVRSLALFEVFAAFDISGRHSWINHLLGLRALLLGRGRKRLPTELDNFLLVDIRRQAIQNALNTYQAVPEVFARQSPVTAKATFDELGPSNSLDELVIRLAELQPKFLSFDVPSAVVAAATALEQDFRDWPDSLPPAWSFATQANTTRSGVRWDARRDVYSKAYAVCVWNKWRAARVRLRNLLLRMESTRREELGAYDFKQLAMDVCASVPVYFRPQRVPGSRLNDGPPALGIIFPLFWPMEVVALAEEAPEDLALWIQQCFERMYDTTNNIIAKVLAMRVKKKLMTLWESREVRKDTVVPEPSQLVAPVEA